VEEQFMRLAEFILANIEPILVEWEEFARSIWPVPLSDAATDPATLRDDAESILRATAEEMMSDQTAVEQSDKSKGHAQNSPAGRRVDRASERHGSGRVGSGFELWAVVAEYRALRASVIRLWRESGPDPDRRDLDDLTRLNESIDQSLTEAVRSYTVQVQRDREALLGNEQAARRDAESANRAKDMFLATLSHEMRTPLNAIVGWISILRMEGSAGANLAEGLDVIERNTKAQVQLMEDVLDVSRIIAGKIRLDIRDCALINAVNAGVDAVRPAAIARDITLHLNLDPAAGRASCDATRVQQIVWNLVSNAVKFASKGGTVNVTLDREQSSSRITVSDNGQGIGRELLPYVFDRFRQADSSTRRQFGGLGLGLSIVKHLAEMHGGTVEAQSAGEGQGATFIVRLPIRVVSVGKIETDDKSAEADDDGPAVADSSGQPLLRLDGSKVLVVDDEADAREMLVKVLEGAGASVMTAASAAEAVAMLGDATENKNGPDVLVSDIGMPGQNGYDLIREVRRRGHSAEALPAVALTAFAHANDAREAELAGFQVHIPKPVNVGEITAVIARLAGRTA
jgi:signal transduction histidine kinase/ActR/RegA family two-component response regulator